jgi:hypothetical protein
MDVNKRRRRTITEVVGAIMVLLLMCSCSRKEKPDKTDGRSNEVDSSAAAVTRDSLVIELPGADSQTVFDLLKSSHQVEYKSSALGMFVTAIDSIENSSGAYWVYSVNDSLPKVASDKYITKDGDMIKWHLRKTRR